MKRLFLLLCCFFSAHLFSFNLNHNHQMLLVLADDWGCNNGEMWQFEKNESNNEWKRVNKCLKVHLGAKGLAWGRGMHPEKRLVGPKKNESDDHSPAGIFRVGPIVGFQPKSEINNLKMPYIHITSSIVAIDDIHSSFYNQILDSNFVEKDWESSMNLKECSFLKWGAIIKYNCHPSISKDGSCIFLCVNNEDIGSQRVTSTCLQEEDLLNVLYWLRQADKPIIVQLTKKNYLQFKDDWQLPDIE